MRLATGKEMREIDRVSIEERGIPGLQLMEKAGEAIADAIGADFDHGGVVTAVCGRGNNGGDGFVAARLLAERGWRVRVALLGTPDSMKGDAFLAWKRLDFSKIQLFECAKPEDLAAAIEGADVLLDALLGTGLAGAPRPPMDWAIRMINESGVPVVAADVPSGLADAEETQDDSPGPVVRAMRTVTMGLPKVALFTTAGLRCSGRVTVAPLDFPRDLLESPAIGRSLLTLEDVAWRLRERPREGHKGLFGSLLIVGGSVGMSGALMLAAGAAGRSGCGLVYLAPPRGILPVVESRVLEPVKWQLPGAENCLDEAAADYLLERIEESRICALAIGPGLGRDKRTARAVLRLVDRAPLPVVIDADALNALSTLEFPAAALKSRAHPIILTPHPGEMAGLVRGSIDDVQRARFAAARKFAREANCVVVLKGAGTVIAAPGEGSEGQVFLNPTGNSGLAKGGSGDVLTGLIGGLLAQKHDPVDAALLGVFLHGMAADIALEQSSPYAITPGDVIERLGAAFRRVEKHARGK